MLETLDNLDDPLNRLLACSVITTGLASVLLFDIHPRSLDLTAHIYAKLLEVAFQKEIKQIDISATTSNDDALMGRWVPSKGQDTLLDWQNGLITSRQDYLYLAKIHDLTRLSPYANRMCVALVDAEFIHFERYGRSDCWQPNIYWLASCSSEPTEVGKISPHLLDRFVLRFSGKLAPQGQEPYNLMPLRLEENHVETVKDIEIASSVKAQLGEALHRMPPKVEETALKEICKYQSVLEAGSRRPIALMRLAQALVRLKSQPQLAVTLGDVHHAADILGLRLPQPVSTILKSQYNLPFVPLPSSIPSALSDTDLPQTVSSLPTMESEISPPTIMPNEEFMSFQSAQNPYPEDDAPVGREVWSLQLRIPKVSKSGTYRGPIIGFQKASSLADLAIVPTLFEAIKFQAIRQAGSADLKDHLILSPADLRSYRRSSFPQEMLVLLLDHTCLEDKDWDQAIIPYLSLAYVERASVCIVQVGHKNALNPLRAEKIITRSILHPLINKALINQPGQATPLAHGLEIGLQTLRRALQVGRNSLSHALFVVVTDGRGNIPLKASVNGIIPSAVGREGIHDALDVARKISSLNRVDRVLINPRPKFYTALPLELAQALNADIIEMTLVDD